MKKSLLILFTLFIGIPLLFAGDLQIFCPAGFSVYLDGQFIGVTNEKYGLIKADIPNGQHSLSIKKDGFESINRSVVIEDNKTFELNIKPKESGFKVESLSPETQEMRNETGTLILRSLPTKCDVYLDSTIVGKSDLKVSQVKSGSHKIRYEFNGEQKTVPITLQNDDELQVKVNFIENTVEISSLLEQRRAEQERLSQQENEARLRKEQETQEAARLASIEEKRKSNGMTLICEYNCKDLNKESEVNSIQNKQAVIKKNKSDQPETKDIVVVDKGGNRHVIRVSYDLSGKRKYHEETVKKGMTKSDYDVVRTYDHDYTTTYHLRYDDTELGSIVRDVEYYCIMTTSYRFMKGSELHFDHKVPTNLKEAYEKTNFTKTYHVDGIAITVKQPEINIWADWMYKIQVDIKNE